MADENDAPPDDDVDERDLDRERSDDRESDRQDDAGDRDRRRRDRDLDSDDPDAEHLGDAGKRALDRMKVERKSLRDDLEKVRGELKKYQDKDKSDTERLTERAESASTRADRAETDLRSLRAALEHAPEGATLDHVRKCAKRIRGVKDEELEADELYGLMDIRKPDERQRPDSKPRERLRPGSGRADPEEPVEETDPRKLAALIPRP